MKDSSSQVFQERITRPKWIAAAEKSTPAAKPKKIGKALGKTLKFRAVTLLTTLSLTWLLTGNPVTSIGLTVLQQGTNTAVYYFFEKNEKKTAFS